MYKRILFRFILCTTLLQTALGFTETECEGSDSLRVFCSSSGNDVIRINEAFWGRINTVTCPHDEADTNTTTCVSPSFFQKVSDNCSGRKECKVPVVTNVLDDPCPGIYKYANVTYECQACRNVLDDSECSARARQGECEDSATRSDMMDNCFQTCSRCDAFSQSDCDNTHGSESSTTRNTDCDRWAFDGECYKNPDWMLANCKESCRACAEESNETVQGCEGEVMNLRCDASYFLEIDDVKYGRFDDSFCMSDDVNDTCPVSTAAQSRVEKACTGRHDCTVRVLNSGLDPRDPCEGQPKQAELMYNCRLCQNTDNEDCRDRADRQECSFNRNYMMENCFKECSGCKEADCDNDYNDVDCDFWAMRGECEANPNYMHYQCAKSCHTCDCMNEANTGRCEYWASIGECEKNPDWMSLYCAKTCGTCDKKAACVNSYGNDAQCQRWASAGECNANPFWMLYRCARACFACGSTVGDFNRKVCEGQATNLYCENTNQKVRITDLFYGRRNNETCPYESFNASISCAANSTAYDNVKEVCNGKSECWIVPVNRVFEDPCPGMSKQLESAFVCQDCTNKAGDEACATRMQNGECASDPETMLDECFQACTSCRQTECSNNADDGDCDFWAMTGECEANPDFMLNQCARSCHQDCS